MTTTSSIQLKDQLALRIENEVRQQMDDILGNIKQIAEKYGIADKDKKSPFRNVLAVSVEPSSSLEIIKNYIRYQVGRGGNASPIWSLKKDDNLFAKELVDALDNLSKDVDAILTRVEISLGKPPTPELDNAADEVTEDNSAADSKDDLPKESTAAEMTTNELLEEAPSDQDTEGQDAEDKTPEPSPGQKKLLNYLANKDNRDTVKRSLHLELAQLYLGYLAREHIAQVGEKEAEKNQPQDGTSDEKSNSSSSKSSHSSSKPSSPTPPRRRR